jgi:hypothetical protein
VIILAQPDSKLTLPLLANAWKNYTHAVLDPIRADPIQRRETKIAFYMGALSLFDGLMSGLSHTENPDEVTAPDLSLLDGVKSELDQFAANMKAGRGA